MAQPLDVLTAPCSSCPYRCDTPPGVWDTSEYEKLREYKPANPYVMPATRVFLCHQTNATGRETVCRGWLTVESDSVAVRLAMRRGEVTEEQVYAEPRVLLYASGTEAAEAGLSGVEEPSPAAVRLMGRLLKKGAAKGA